MTFLRKFLFMNIGVPCRQSGLYFFRGNMGAPEDDNSCKLTKFKKMSSTPELDRYEDEDDSVDGEVTGGTSEDAIVTDVQSPTTSSPAMDDVMGAGPSDVPGLSDATVAPTGDLVSAEASAKVVAKDVTVERRSYSDVLKNIVTNAAPDHTSPVAAKDADNRVAGEVQDSSEREASTCAVPSAVAEVSESVTDSPCDERENSACDSANLECHDCKDSAVEQDVCQTTPKADDGDEPSRVALESSCANSSEKDLSALTENMNECQSSDDMDSLGLSDIEDNRSSSTHSSTPTPSSNNESASNTPKSNTPTPTSAPLDLSDILRVSEDIFSQTPGTTLDLLQVSDGGDSRILKDTVERTLVGDRNSLSGARVESREEWDLVIFPVWC